MAYFDKYNEHLVTMICQPMGNRTVGEIVHARKPIVEAIRKNNPDVITVVDNIHQPTVDCTVVDDDSASADLYYKKYIVATELHDDGTPSLWSFENKHRDEMAQSLYTLGMITTCDFLIFLEDYVHSPGCIFELEWAKRFNIPYVIVRMRTDGGFLFITPPHWENDFKRMFCLNPEIDVAGYGSNFIEAHKRIEFATDEERANSDNTIVEEGILSRIGLSPTT